MPQQITCTMTDCQYNSDRKCIKDDVYIDINWEDRPVCTDYIKTERGINL